MSKTPLVASGLPLSGPHDVICPYLNASSVVAITADLFGSRAATLSAWYALDARQARRHGDYRLWLIAFKHHQGRVRGSA